MILITGAAGKTGRAVVRALVRRDQDVRALVRRHEQRKAMLALGVSQVIIGDLGERSIIEQAVDGATAIYHICPNVEPLEIEYAELLINAALAAKVRRFAYHSVLHPQTERMIHHWKKLRVEERLFESSLNFTIVQPCAYMQNLLVQRESIIGDGVITVPYSVNAKLSLVDLEDVADAIGTILCEPGHVGAIYEMAGPEPISHRQIAALLSTLLQKPIRVKQVEIDKWTRRARSKGLGVYAINALQSMFAYYDSYGFRGNSNALMFLLGHEPNRLENFLKNELRVDD